MAAQDTSAVEGAITDGLAEGTTCPGGLELASDGAQGGLTTTVRAAKGGATDASAQEAAGEQVVG